MTGAKTTHLIVRPSVLAGCVYVVAYAGKRAVIGYTTPADQIEHLPAVRRARAEGLPVTEEE